MSDPLSRLGSLGSSERAPDLDAIKLRAHRIRRRRQTGLASAGAAAMAVIAVVGVLLATGPGDDRPTTSLAEAVDAGTPQPRKLEYRAPSAVKVAPDAAQSVAGGQTTSGSAGVGGAAPSTASRTNASRGEAALAPAADSETKDELTVTLEIADQMLGRGKTFTLKACNTTSGTVGRSFGSSQRYDFEVSDAEGKLVWRWSDGMFFTQVIGEESWKAKECKEWSENWDGSTSDGGRAPAGDYRVVAILKSQPEIRTKPTSTSLSAL